MSVQIFLLTQKSTKLEFPVSCFLLVFHSNNLTLSTIRFLSDITHYELEFFSSSFFREFCNTLIIFINNLLYFFLISHLTFPPIVFSYIAVEVLAEHYQHQNILRIYDLLFIYPYSNTSLTKSVIGLKSSVFIIGSSKVSPLRNPIISILLLEWFFSINSSAKDLILNTFPIDNV